MASSMQHIFCVVCDRYIPLGMPLSLHEATAHHRHAAVDATLPRHTHRSEATQTATYRSIGTQPPRTTAEEAEKEEEEQADEKGPVSPSPEPRRQPPSIRVVIHHPEPATGGQQKAKRGVGFRVAEDSSGVVCSPEPTHFPPPQNKAATPRSREEECGAEDERGEGSEGRSPIPYCVELDKQSAAASAAGDPFSLQCGREPRPAPRAMADSSTAEVVMVVDQGVCCDRSREEGEAGGDVLHCATCGEPYHRGYWPEHVVSAPHKAVRIQTLEKLKRILAHHSTASTDGSSGWEGVPPPPSSPPHDSDDAAVLLVHRQRKNDNDQNLEVEVKEKEKRNFVLHVEKKQEQPAVAVTEQCDLPSCPCLCHPLKETRNKMKNAADAFYLKKRKVALLRCFLQWHRKWALREAKRGAGGDFEAATAAAIRDAVKREIQKQMLTQQQQWAISDEMGVEEEGGECHHCRHGDQRCVRHLTHRWKLPPTHHHHHHHHQLSGYRAQTSNSKNKQRTTSPPPPPSSSPSPNSPVAARAAAVVVNCNKNSEGSAAAVPSSPKPVSPQPAAAAAPWMSNFSLETQKMLAKTMSKLSRVHTTASPKPDSERNRHRKNRSKIDDAAAVSVLPPPPLVSAIATVAPSGILRGSGRGTQQGELVPKNRSDVSTKTPKAGGEEAVVKKSHQQQPQPLSETCSASHPEGLNKSREHQKRLPPPPPSAATLSTSKVTTAPPPSDSTPDSTKHVDGCSCCGCCFCGGDLRTGERHLRTLLRHTLWEGLPADRKGGRWGCYLDRLASAAEELAGQQRAVLAEKGAFVDAQVANGRKKK